MSHNLATIHGKTAMFYSGEPPWHGLGVELERPATAAEAIKAASLDWEVVKMPLHLKVDSRYRDAEDAFAVVRRDAVARNPVPVLGIVGKEYTPLQNRDAFGWFDSIVGQKAAVYHTAGALGNGERVWILAKLPGEIRVTDEDIAEKYLLLSNSHDGSSAVQVKFTPIRVVCQNTLTMALSTGRGLCIAHTRSLAERLALAGRNLGIINERFQNIEWAFKRMKGVDMKEHRLDEYLALVFPKPTDDQDRAGRSRVLQAREGARRLFEAGQGNDLPSVHGTLWAAYNGVAEYVDYHRESKTPDNRLDSVWFGMGYLWKARAYRVATNRIEAWKN